MSSTSASSPAASNSCPSPSEGFIWDVQEILAERTSINGGNEVLVVMKTAWVPVNQMIADCPAMQRWRETVQWNFSSDSKAHRIKLPVQPGSVLAWDHAADKELPAAAAAKCHFCSTVASQTDANSRSRSSSFSTNSADDEDNGTRNVRRYMSPASRRQYPRPNRDVRE
jgi:hypothetical protein